MNALSFLIYLIGVITNLSHVVIFLTIAGAVLTIATVIFGSIHSTDDSYSWNDKKTRVEWRNKVVWPKLKLFISIFSLGLFLQIIVPNKETMVLIAASEVGEYVINTEAVQSASNEIGALSKDSIGLLREYIATEVSALRSARETKETK